MSNSLVNVLIWIVSCRLKVDYCPKPSASGLIDWTKQRLSCSFGGTSRAYYSSKSRYCLITAGSRFLADFRLPGLALPDPILIHCQCLDCYRGDVPFTLLPGNSFDSSVLHFACFGSFAGCRSRSHRGFQMMAMLNYTSFIITFVAEHQPAQRINASAS